jgi:Pectate lyase superfamily protein
MPVQFTAGRFSATTDAGLPLVGGRLYTYLSGTSTFQTTYTTATLGAQNTYTDDGTGQLYLTLDARGEASVWLTPATAYSMVLKTPLGATIWTDDGVIDQGDQLRADLASTASGKGAALVGYKLTETGSVARTVLQKLDDYVCVLDFGAVGDGVADDTTAFQSAIDTGRYVLVPYGSYKIVGPLNLKEGGLIGEGFGVGGAGAQFAKLTFYNCTNTLNGAIYTRISTQKSQFPRLENLYIEASSWDGTTGCLGYGLDIEAPIIASRLYITGFKKSGVFLHNDAAGVGPYESIFTNVRSLVNGQHGFLVGAGANVITLINCEAKWNGAPSYGTTPTVAGSYDGIYVDNTSDGSSYLSFHPTSLAIIGGDCSYNSRYGLNVVDSTGANIQLGYSEQNKSADGYQHAVGAQLRNNTINFVFVTATQGFEVFNGQSSSVLAQTNRIWANGYNFGGGGNAGQTQVYDKSYSTNGGKRTRILYLGSDDNGATNSTQLQADVSGNAFFNTNGTGKFQFTSGVQVGNANVSDANTLDWYVESTFTPTIAGTTTAGAGTYTTQIGEQTRIGNRMFVNIVLTWTAHTGTGSMKVNGLSTAAKNTTGAVWALSVVYDGIVVGAGKEAGAAVLANGTSISLYDMDQAGGALALMALDTAGSLYIQGSYPI